MAALLLTPRQVRIGLNLFTGAMVVSVAVALAAGLHASRIDGSPIVYNQASTSIPDLLICRREWAPIVLEAVRDCGQ